MDTLRTSTKTLLVSAAVALLVLLLAPLAYRFGLAPLGASLRTLPIAAVGGALVTLAGIYFLWGAIRAAMLHCLRAVLAGIYFLWGALRDRRLVDRNMTLLAMGLGLLPALLVVPWILQARSVPPIHDITTDTGNPPQFVALAKERKAAPNGSAYGSERWPPARLAEAQRQAYPDIQPIVTDLGVDEALVRAKAVLEDMGLELAPAESASGQLEATQTSFWYGFKDDLIVRATPMQTGGARLDLRSMSRIGGSDIGMNAARIADFTARFAESTD